MGANRQKLITVRFTPAEYKRIEDEAALKGLSVSNTIRHLALIRKKKSDEKNRDSQALMKRLEDKVDDVLEKVTGIIQGGNSR